MRKPRWYDWLGATTVWGMVSTFTGVFLSEGLGAPEEVGIMTFFTLFVGGLAGARVWWLRRVGSSDESDRERDGLTTGEMTAQRLELMEQRIYELEERLELSERMLLQAQSRERLPLRVPEQPQ
ncbi:MAG TPA: hypothetical protein VMK53_07980 [Gemmatimonadales bacterium]|nr:hypothetical protein [Gemmatimonadales bacterium]